MLFVADLFAQELGASLKRLRKSRDLTQPDLAAELAARGFPVDQSTLSKWEKGKLPPSILNFVAAIQLLRDLPHLATDTGLVSLVSGHAMRHESSSTHAAPGVVKDASSLSTSRGTHAAPHQHPSADPSRRHQLAEAIDVLTAAANQLVQIAKALEGDDTDEPDTGTAPSSTRPPQRPTPRKRPSPRRDRR